MSAYHDPIRHGTALSEVYAEDKRPIGLLLTAGCPYSVKINDSRDPLVPDIAGLTAFVETSVTDRDLSAKLAAIVETLGAAGDPPNIESILTYIRGLMQVVGAGEIRGLTASDLESLDVAISKAIFSAVNVNLPEQKTPFEQVAHWVGSIQRSMPVEIFTTNYDLLIEQALERARVPYFDGFVGSTRAFLDERAIDDDALPPRWARLWKLHGSINWQLDKDKSAIRLSSGDSANCPLIHPSHLKYAESRRMPYLAMVDRLRSFLKLDSAVLLVSGYSFRDEHIDDVLLQGVRANPTAAVFAVQYGPLNRYPAAIRLGTSARNFIVFAEDEAIIGAVQAPWRTLPQASSMSHHVAAFWKPDGEGGAADDLVPGRFLLGDFNQLGTLLVQLVSRKRL